MTTPKNEHDLAILEGIEVPEDAVQWHNVICGNCEGEGTTWGGLTFGPSDYILDHLANLKGQT